MASNTLRNEITLIHPLTQDTSIDSCSIRDTLSNSASTLYLLADLFGGDTDNSQVLESRHAKRGMWLQLYGVANALEAAESYLNREAEKDRADREARRATEERIEADPEVITKTTILAKAFAQAYRELSDKDGKEGADDAALL
jgi:hypothetical protein